MLSKDLRILIADSDQPLRLAVEKLVNHAGCYGVAVVPTVEEVVALLDFPGRPFDFVLINSQLLDQASYSTLDVLNNHRNVVLYRNGLYSGHLADPLAVIREGLSLPSPVITLH
jgi:DNA-binding NtrC family response regulator